MIYDLSKSISISYKLYIRSSSVTKLLLLALRGQKTIKTNNYYLSCYFTTPKLNHLDLRKSESSKPLCTISFISTNRELCFDYSHQTLKSNKNA